MSADDSLKEKLAGVVLAHITDCKGLVSVDRLSGGASQETYRLVIETSVGEKRLALRRAPGGEYAEITPQHPGLDVEALLMQSALAVGVPEPEVYYVLQREDELGDGFLMEWLDGEALGARIVRNVARYWQRSILLILMRRVSGRGFGKFPLRNLLNRPGSGTDSWIRPSL